MGGFSEAPRVTETELSRVFLLPVGHGGAGGVDVVAFPDVAAVAIAPNRAVVIAEVLWEGSDCVLVPVSGSLFEHEYEAVAAALRGFDVLWAVHVADVVIDPCVGVVGVGAAGGTVSCGRHRVPNTYTRLLIKAPKLKR